MELLASTIRDIGFVVYGGPMVAWAILLAAQGRLNSLDAPSIIRVFRAWGPGFGLSLGACVLGALLTRYLETEAFYWSLDTPEQRLDTGVWGLFLLMWVSNIKLEIWTLDPLRKLDGEDGITDPDSYRSSATKLKRHLAVHALLVLAVGALDGEDGITDPDSYRSSATKLKRHLAVHALLVLAVGAGSALLRA